MSQRVGYLDVARGIGILLVVLGHNDFGSLSPFLQRVIYSFHLPLFFFLSGYFMDRVLSFAEFFKKRFHSILKPYLFTVFLIYFASVSFEKMGFQTAMSRILKALYGSINYIDWGQLWFLPHLFVVSLYAFLFLGFLSRFQNRWIRWSSLLVSLVISLLFLRAFYPFPVSLFGRQYEIYGLPFSLDLILLSGFFFLMGSQARQFTSERTFDNVFLPIGAGIGLIALNYFSPYRVDIAVRVYESLLVNTAEAALGILFVLGLARSIDLHTVRLASFLKYLGNISLIILIFHLPIQAFWAEKVMAVTRNLPLSLLAGFVMGVAGSILIHELFIRYNPIASYWFGRTADVYDPDEFLVRQEQAAVKPVGTPIVEAKES